MSVRIDRDVINALIAGHFADPFSALLQIVGGDKLIIPFC